MYYHLSSWWCDLVFLSSDDGGNNYGYVGRGIQFFLGSTLDDSSLAQVLGAATSVSAIFVPVLGIFEARIHQTHDNSVARFWVG